MANHDQENATRPPAFKTIALSLSGGGVRALGFHVGVLSMLDRLGLINQVTILSTVSGGSMSGIGFALAQHFGRSFQDFIDDFYEFLPSLNVIEELLARVTAQQPPSPSGRRDLITALANVYDECYFHKFYGGYVDGGPLHFGILLDHPGRGHLQEMCFNATEFKSGTAFRFQVSRYRCLIGNENVSLCHKHAAMMRIADVMAASSCIPAGMEPLFFPDDFHWPGDGQWGRLGRAPERPVKDEISQALARNTDTKEESFVLMDGGVYDNQGIISTLLAINRIRTRHQKEDPHQCGFSLRESGEPAGPEQWANWMSGKVGDGEGSPGLEIGEDELDLLIISDTPVRKASFYPKIPMPETVHGEQEPLAQLTNPRPGKPGWIYRMKVGTLSRIGWVLVGLLLVSAGISLLEMYQHLTQPDLKAPFDQVGFFVLHLAVPLLLLVLTAAGLIAYKMKKAKGIEALQKLIPHWRNDPGRYINDLRVGDIITMASLRAGSVSALTSSIYMNRIRALGYTTAYGRDDLRHRILSNEIFSLVDKDPQKDDFRDMLRQKGLWPPPPRLTRIAMKSANMATKLWIDKAADDALNDFDYLVIAGQATFCYNLMHYLWIYRGGHAGTMDPVARELFDRAMDEWRKLAEEPTVLLDGYKANSRLPELRAQVA